MLQHSELTPDLSMLLPEDGEAARELLERDLVATLRPARDYFEDRVDLLRYWVAHRQAEIGEQWLHGLIDGLHASMLFSVLAEVVVTVMLPLVTTTLAYNQGRILKGRFVVLALGKLGSREMTVQSDLDLLFVYDVPPAIEETDGPEPTAVSAYYAKLGQKLIAALTIMTERGSLFEVDMRLRPFGDSGPIASSRGAFRRYYESDAWTWEHMALTRARVIAGDPDLGAIVTADIRDILTRPRDRKKILADVADMRERIARQHPATIAWDCKHRRGGLIDIEFIAQAYQLMHAADAPDVLAPSTREALSRLRDRGFLGEAGADLVGSLAFWQSLQGLIRVTQDRAGVTKLSPQLFDKVLMDLTGIEDYEARQQRAEAVAAVARAHYEALVEAAAGPR